MSDDAETTTPDIIPADDYEIRITPLIRPLESNDFWHIGYSETTLVTQYADLDVGHPLNDDRTVSFTVPMSDPVVTDLKPFEFAVWIGYLRSGNLLPEAIFYGQANCIDDYENDVVQIVAIGPSQRASHHYSRIGDDALNNLDNDNDPETGLVTLDGEGIATVLQGLYNTPDQDDLDLPSPGILVGSDFTESSSYTVGIERGQEIWQTIKDITAAREGPDIDVQPDYFPMWNYGYIDIYRAPHTPPADGYELGRYLDPVDPDDPQPGEMVLDYGMGNQLLKSLKITPGRPTTNCHVTAANQDQGIAYRRSAGDFTAAYNTGIWVDWIAADFKIASASTDDTQPLYELAKARVEAYAYPPLFLEVELHPIALTTYKYGNPNWYGRVDPDTFGDFYIGDRIRIRGQRNNRSVSLLARIIEIHHIRESWNGLPTITLKLIPSIIPEEDGGGD